MPAWLRAPGSRSTDESVVANDSIMIARPRAAAAADARPVDGRT